MRIPLLSVATAAMVATGVPASASIVLTYSDGTFVNDIDGKPPAFRDAAKLDIETVNSTSIPLDIRIFDLNGSGDIFKYTVSRIDDDEIAALSPVSTAPNVTLSEADDGALYYDYQVEGTDTDGDVLASFEVDTDMVDLRPGDEFSDISVVDAENPLGIWDPAEQEKAATVAFDVQAVPLPAGVFFLASALGGLGVMRWRNPE